MDVLKFTDGITLQNCLNCNEKLSPERGVYYHDCIHVYCPNCKPPKSNCLCHPNGHRYNFSDDPVCNRRLRRFNDLLSGEYEGYTSDEDEFEPMAVDDDPLPSTSANFAQNGFAASSSVQDDSMDDYQNADVSSTEAAGSLEEEAVDMTSVHSDSCDNSDDEDISTSKNAATLQDPIINVTSVHDDSSNSSDDADTSTLEAGAPLDDQTMNEASVYDDNSGHSDDADISTLEANAPLVEDQTVNVTSVNGDSSDNSDDADVSLSKVAAKHKKATPSVTQAPNPQSESPALLSFAALVRQSQEDCLNLWKRTPKFIDIPIPLQSGLPQGRINIFCCTLRPVVHSNVINKFLDHFINGEKSQSIFSADICIVPHDYQDAQNWFLLCAAAKRIPIVSVQWCADCLENNQILPVDGYMVWPEWLPGHKEGCGNAKANADNLFTGFSFKIGSLEGARNRSYSNFMCKTSTMNLKVLSTDMSKFITATGGVLATNKTDLSQLGARNNSKIPPTLLNTSVIQLERILPERLDSEQEVKTLPLSWFFQCVARHKILDPDRFT